MHIDNSIKKSKNSREKIEENQKQLKLKMNKKATRNPKNRSQDQTYPI